MQPMNPMVPEQSPRRPVAPTQEAVTPVPSTETQPQPAQTEQPQSTAQPIESTQPASVDTGHAADAIRGQLQDPIAAAEAAIDQAPTETEHLSADHFEAAAEQVVDNPAALEEIFIQNVNHPAELPDHEGHLE